MEEEKMIQSAGAGEGRKIVVAVDESEESMQALSWCFTNLVSENSTNTPTTVYLLYVKPPVPLYSSIDAAGYLFSGDIVGKMENYSKELAHSVMNRAESVYGNFNIAAANNIKLEKKVGMGDAKEMICFAVEKLEADVLVMGSHDYGFFKRALLGSVSDYCAKHVKCPVVVVKRPNH
ncbi:universal stress protein PHOS32-like [Impatiens glandulifera]|uniref:universal stress protein PHOS32-like n=1 Tax=Impatiens glandulifera TaxID=253017 RepID=UPI001FB082BE|nr:universal stress protein PHOS32-like [Impatiens glandulifera]